MKRNIACLIAVLMTAATIAAANIELFWTPNAPEDAVSQYTVYQTASLTAPFLPVAATTNSTVKLSVNPGVYFFYVTAISSNAFWGNLESQPSNTASTPAAKTPLMPAGLAIVKVP